MALTVESEKVIEMNLFPEEKQALRESHLMVAKGESRAG